MYRLLAILILAGCTQPSGDGTNAPASRPPATIAGPNDVAPQPQSEFRELLDSAGKADGVVVARLEAVDFSAPDRDGFLTDMRFRITGVLRGSLRAGETVRVRHVLGRESDGNWRWTADTPWISPSADSRMKIGEEFLLFTSTATYRAQAAARNRTPLEDSSGVGLGLYRIRGGAIEQTGSYPLPATVEALQTLLKGH